MINKKTSLILLKKIHKHFVNKIFFIKKATILKRTAVLPLVKTFFLNEKFYSSFVINKKLKKFVFVNKSNFKKLHKKELSPVLTKLIFKKELLKSTNPFLYSTFIKMFLKKKCICNSNLNFHLKSLIVAILNLKSNSFNKIETSFLKKSYVLLQNNKFKTAEIFFKKRLIFLLLQKYFLIAGAESYSNISLFYNKFFFNYIQISKKINYNKNIFNNVENSPIHLKKKNSIALEFYKKFIGLSLKKGCKTKALNFIQEALQNVSKHLNLSVNFVLLKILSRLKMSLELKTVRKKVRKTKKKIFHIVPYPIRKKRELFLIIKLILKATRQKSNKKPVIQKLSQELITLLKTKKKSQTFKIKRSTIQAALKNRSNKHFRW